MAAHRTLSRVGRVDRALALWVAHYLFKAPTVRTPATLIDATRARLTQMRSRLLLCVALD